MRAPWRLATPSCQMRVNMDGTRHDYDTTLDWSCVASLDCEENRLEFTYRGQTFDNLYVSSLGAMIRKLLSIQNMELLQHYLASHEANKKEACRGTPRFLSPPPFSHANLPPHPSCMAATLWPLWGNAPAPQPCQDITCKKKRSLGKFTRSHVQQSLRPPLVCLIRLLLLHFRFGA